MDLGLAGRKALVCAGSKGLGKGVAMALAREGAAVFLCARGEAALAETAAELAALGAADVAWLACDLSVPDQQEALVAAVNARFDGTLDILVHNTGGPPAGVAEETTLAQWQAGFDRLFSPVVALNQAFLPGMKGRQWGRIVLITSSSVLEPIANLAVSNAMRSAVTSMAKTLSDEVASFGVTVNCAAPGIVYTERTEERLAATVARHGGTREDHLQGYVRSIPAGRLGTIEEFGAAVAFLCSAQAGYITGSTLSIDGGKRRSTY